jgi:hypothetical protein
VLGRALAHASGTCSHQWGVAEWGRRPDKAQVRR